METIEKDTKTKERKFNILVAEKKQIFAQQLRYIVSTYKPIFPGINFKIKIIKDPLKFSFSSLNNIQITFIEDDFVLDISTFSSPKLNTKKDVVLLIYDSFSNNTLLEIKKFIDKNSLNLCGHISLTNYTFNLIKLLVTDFIKVKLQLYDSEET